jgi:hypothetical protein
MNDNQIMKIVEQYSRKSEAGYGSIKVTRVPDHKTVYIEQIGDDGRSIVLTEYKVDGATYWAGFSSRSQTVFISLAA